MADPKTYPDYPLETREDREVGRVEHEALKLERETEQWSDGIRLSQPGAVPHYSDLLSSLHASLRLCERMAANPRESASEVKFLDKVEDGLNKLITMVRDHVEELHQSGSGT
jgi:hypothetical protein